MTRQETFKRRIRARMERTGERYTAARRALIDRSDGSGSGTWASEPDTSDETVRSATGREWNEWREVIDAWSGRDEGHGAIVTYLIDQHGVDGWWAQTVTVGYERITGRRRPHQAPAGTFTATKSRTMTVDGDALRQMLLDDDDREALFPGFATELRSRPTSKALRVAIGPGTALFDIAPRSDGRATITVSHERLPNAEDVAPWKDYWAAWLDALGEG